MQFSYNANAPLLSLCVSCGIAARKAGELLVVVSETLVDKAIVVHHIKCVQRSRFLSCTVEGRVV